MQTEVNFLGQLRHPNLVKLIGYCCEDDHRLLVYEFMFRGSLEHHLFRSMFFNPLSLLIPFHTIHNPLSTTPTSYFLEVYYTWGSYNIMIEYVLCKIKATKTLKVALQHFNQKLCDWEYLINIVPPWQLMLWDTSTIICTKCFLTPPVSKNLQSSLEKMFVTHSFSSYFSSCIDTYPLINHHCDRSDPIQVKHVISHNYYFFLFSIVVT